MENFLIALFSGFGTGIILTLMLGTVFFALIEDGMAHGFKAGAAIAFGVIATDIVFILLAHLFTKATSEFIQTHKEIILIASGTFIIGLGTMGLVKTSKNKDVKSSTANFSTIKLILKGAALNGTNPVNFFAWLSLETVLIANNVNQTYFWTYFAGCLFMIFAMEVLFAFLAKKLAQKLKDGLMHKVKFAINIIFIALGILVVLKGIFPQLLGDSLGA